MASLETAIEQLGEQPNHEYTWDSAKNADNSPRLQSPIAGSFDLEDSTEEGDLEADRWALRDALQKVLDKNPIGLDPEGKYFPDEDYDVLFTSTAIRKALGGRAKSLPLVKYVSSCAKKTFATLLLVFSDCKDRETAMRAFSILNLTDEDLSKRVCLGKFPPASQLRPWDATAVEDFETKRYHFLVPTFEKKKFIYDFNIRQVLPFTKKVSPKHPFSGTFSDVTQVEMLASKQDMKDTNGQRTIVVALKRLKNLPQKEYNIETEWKREAKAHMQLNEKSPHLIQAFAAFKQIAADPQKHTYSLVLEWADGGTLQGYWQNNPGCQLDDQDALRIIRSRERAMEVLNQLLGLADALEGIHSTSSRVPRQIGHVSGPSSPGFTPLGNTGARWGSLGSDLAPVDLADLPTIDFGRPISAEEISPLPWKHQISAPDSEGSATILQDLTRRETGFGSENWRHGDIKPENILRFLSGTVNGSGLGLLKLADLGGARQQLLATKVRQSRENVLWRTNWYEPPDLKEDEHDEAGGNRSRLFDIWSMGCVMFETVLWMLYGYGSVTQFMKSSNLASGATNGTPYWRKISREDYEVSPVAIEWMDNILVNEAQRSGAMCDLITLVKERLLRIELPEDAEFYTEGCRTNATDLKDRLTDIIRKAEDEEYLFRAVARTGDYPWDLHQNRKEPIAKDGAKNAKAAGPSFLSLDEGILDQRVARPDDNSEPLSPSFLPTTVQDTGQDMSGKDTKDEAEDRIRTIVRNNKQITFMSATLVPQPGVVDLVKTLIEKRMTHPLIWWPLRPANRACPVGHTRIAWSCGCGTKIQLDLPDDAARTYEKLSSLNTITLPSSDPPLLPVHSPQSSGTASGVSSNFQSITFPAAATLSARTQKPSDANTQGTVPSTTAGKKPKFVLGLQHSLFIHWCIDASRIKTILFHIGIPHLKDLTVLPELKSLYQSSKGFRRWFSITDCYGIRLVMFRRIDKREEIVVCVPGEIPDSADPDYSFTYFDPRDAFIKTVEATLIHRFHNPSGCTADDMEDILGLIPKKTKCKLGMEYNVTGYGMRAIPGWAVWKIVVALVLTQTGPLTFAIWWMYGHPGDWSNAFTPAMYIAALSAILVVLPDILTMPN